MDKDPVPFRNDSERGLLASLLRNPSIMDMAGGLSSQIFHLPAHKIIFSRIAEVYQDTGGCDWVLLSESFRLPELHEIGGLMYVSELYDVCPTDANWDFYLKNVTDAYERRQTINICKYIIGKAYDLQTDVDCSSLMEEGSRSIMHGSVTASKEVFWKQHVDEEIDQILSGKIKHRYFELSGLHNLDAELGGVFPGDMIVIASETSRGKTALSLQIAAHMALDDQNLKIAIFSFEMDAQALRQRIISSRSEVRMSAIRYCEMTDHDIKKLRDFKANTPSGRTIIIEDSFSLTTEGVLSRCRRLKNDGELHAIVVDYLQLVNPTSSRSQSRQTEVQEISRNLKLLAGKLGVVVIALSQVNDLGQMRESRAISHDADIILQIKDNEESSGTSEREIEILKNRNGPRGKSVKLHFYGDYTSFSDE